MTKEKLVTAIITTVDRDSELIRAIKSIEQQTYKNIEIVVVIDGVNERIKTILQNYKSKCVLSLECFETIEKKGGNYARNFGIDQAKGKYIALLDDDDEWLPEKIEQQLNLCRSFQNKSIIFCSVINRMKSTEVVLPRKNFDNSNGNIVDYLFSYRYGLKSGFIQTSTLFGSKNIFKEVPFDNELVKHQDWDWVIQASVKGISFKHIKKPLVIYHNEEQANRVGRSGTYKFSMEWIEKNRNKIKKKYYYLFLYTVIQLAISSDNDLCYEEKKTELTNIRNKVPFTEKWSVTYLYYFIKANRNLEKTRTRI